MKWFVEIGVEEQSPELNPFEHIWDEFESRLRAKPNRPTSLPDHTNALVAEWKQFLAAMMSRRLIHYYVFAYSENPVSGMVNSGNSLVSTELG